VFGEPSLIANGDALSSSSTVSLGLGHFLRDISPRTFSLDKNANNVVEIEAGLMKKYVLSRSWNCWIDETILC